MDESEALGQLVGQIPDATNAYRWLGAAVIIILGLVIGAWVVHRWNLKWTYYGAAVGVVVGLIAGTVIIFRVPLAAQYVVLGAFLGMGADGLTALAQPSGPRTAISALARAVAELVTASRQAGAPRGAEKPIAAGVWSAFGTIFLMILLGLLEATAT